MTPIKTENVRIQWKRVVLLYISFVLFRFLLALMVLEPVVFPDELVYKSMSYGFYKWLDFFALSPGTVGAPTNIGYVFYQFVISPMFFFNGHFLVAGKLLNALIINTAIFPIYGILKDFIPGREAVASAAVPLLLPSFGYSVFLMAENIYIPLCAFFLYALYKTWSGGRSYFSVLAAAVLLALLLTKPYALLLIAAVAVCGGSLSLFFIFRANDKTLGQKTLFSLGLFFLTLILSAAAFFWLSKNSFLQIFGFTLAVAQNIPKEIARIFGTGGLDLIDFLGMTVTHIGGFFFLLLHPFLVTVWAWIDSVKTKCVKSLIFSTFGLFIFLELFALVLLGSVYFSPDQSFSRLHGRFYSVFFFFLLASYAAFRKKVEWTRPRKITLSVFALLTVFSIIPAASHYFRFPAHIMIPIDYPEMSWLAFCPLAVVILLIACFCLMTGQVLLRNNFKTYSVYFFILAILANSAQTQALLKTFQPQRLLTRPTRAFISETIKDFDSRVAVFDREEMYGNLTVFWLPYTFTMVKFNFTDVVLKREVIPDETDYVVLFGEYDLDFSPDVRIREGRCTILHLARPLAAQNRPIAQHTGQTSARLDKITARIPFKNLSDQGKSVSRPKSHLQRARMWRREKSQIPMVK